MDRQDAGGREVVVTDIRMPFGSMVVFMVKWAVAAIPAFIIVAVIWYVLAALLMGFGMMGGMGMRPGV